jgi:uncharacterized protein YkwD
LLGSTTYERFRPKSLTGWRTLRYHLCDATVSSLLPKGVRMLRRVLTGTLVALAMCAFTASSASAAVLAERATANTTAQNDLVALINGYRAANGLQQVSVNGALTGAATWMAQDMAARNYLGHVSSDGRSPTQRMSAFGYPATSMYTGEDLGAGYGTASAVLAGWQASAAHNAVLLNPNYNAVGIGLMYNANSTYKWYWAADFGGPGGTVKVVVPPPPPAPPRQVAPAPEAVPERAATVARGTEEKAAEEIVDPEAAALAARIAFSESVGARRITHLIAVLDRMGIL